LEGDNFDLGVIYKRRGKGVEGLSEDGSELKLNWSIFSTGGNFFFLENRKPKPGFVGRRRRCALIIRQLNASLFRVGRSAGAGEMCEHRALFKPNYS
jgi:hypothetical protein